jgi:hypothetical protein
MGDIEQTPLKGIIEETPFVGEIETDGAVGEIDQTFIGEMGGGPCKGVMDIP